MILLVHPMGDTGVRENNNNVIVTEASTEWLQ